MPSDLTCISESPQLRDRLHDIVITLEEQGDARAMVLSWLKGAGEHVTAGEPVAEVETDKVTVEVISPATGILVDVKKETQAAVQIGEVIGRVRVKSTPDAESRGSGSPPEALAEAKGAALPGGVHAYGSEPKGPAHRTFVPHSPKQKIVAERVVASLLHGAPHVTSVFDVDLSRVAAHREQHRRTGSGSVTYTAYFVYAAVEALRTVPEVNSRYLEEGLEVMSDINVGIVTVVRENDIVVPVLHGAQGLSFDEMAARVHALTEKARVGRLTMAETTNGTFTISNHGVSGSLFATPIVIYPPQAAILGIGKIENRPTVVSVGGRDEIRVHPKAYVTLTIDHRALNGSTTNAFLKKFCDSLAGWPITDAAAGALG